MTTAATPTALYRLFDAAEQLLYVGISTQPETRWTQHAADKPWWPLVQHRKTEWHADRKAAEDAERAAVQSEEPLYNTAGAKRSLLATHFPIGESMTQAQARLRFSDVLDATQFGGQSVTITRRGKTAGVLVPPDWYDAAVAALAEVKELRRENAELQQPAAE
jgi:prevent-host-death family protein